MGDGETLKSFQAQKPSNIVPETVLSIVAGCFMKTPSPLDFHIADFINNVMFNTSHFTIRWSCI